VVTTLNEFSVEFKMLAGFAKFEQALVQMRETDF